MVSFHSAFRLILVGAGMALAAAFVPTRTSLAATRSALRASGDDEESKLSIPNFFNELAEMASNFDDVVDDFFFKRMGNGEVFYGKRKYKPSGRILGDYNGGGFSDWQTIEAARAFREERAMMREMAREQNNEQRQ